MLFCKGFDIKADIDFIVENYGEEKLKEIINSLPPTHREIFLKPIISGKKYPFETLCSFEKAACDILANGDPSFGRNFGRNIATKMLSGAFSVLLKLASIPFAVSKAGWMFSFFYSEGKLEAVETDYKNKRVKLRLSEFPIKSRVFEEALVGFMEVVLTKLGAKNVKIDILSSTSKDDPFTEFLVVWE